MREISVAETVTLKLEQINDPADLQSRAAMCMSTVDEYAEAMTEGATFPPAVVYFDGADHWLAEGFHRKAAAKAIGAVSMLCELRTGSRLDALLCSLASNQAHGLRRTSADKRRAVEGMLRLKPDFSDRAIAKHVGVSNTFVSKLRASLSTVDSEKSERTYTTKHGNTATMDVSGQKKAAKERAQGTSVATARDEPASGPVAEFTPTADVIDEVDDSHALLEELQAQNVALADLVKAAEADDTKAEVIKWRKAYDNATRQQSEAMSRAKAATDREAWAMAQLRRCGKAVRVDDPTKIAAAVEAAVRAQEAA